MLGSNNDINVLEASNLFANLAKNIAPLTHYIIQEKCNNVAYYLAHDIHSKWSTYSCTNYSPFIWSK